MESAWRRPRASGVARLSRVRGRALGGAGWDHALWILLLAALKALCQQNDAIDQTVALSRPQLDLAQSLTAGSAMVAISSSPTSRFFPGGNGYGREEILTAYAALGDKSAFS